MIKLIDILKEIQMHAIKLIVFPEFRQAYDYDCGANALQAILAYFGDDVAEGDLMIDLKTDPNLGTNTSDIVRVSEEYGIKCQVKHNMTIDDLKLNINNNVPTLILVQAWTENQNVNWKTDWEDGHYVTAIGYTSDSIIFEDPSSVVRTYITFDELNDRWHDVDEKSNGEKTILEHFGISFYGKQQDYDPTNMIQMD